jgi:hypothetical protein
LNQEVNDDVTTQQWCKRNNCDFATAQNCIEVPHRRRRLFTHLQMEDLSSLSSPELIRLWTIRRTLMKMLEDRGYVVPTAEKNLTAERWKERVYDPATVTVNREKILPSSTCLKEDPSSFCFVIIPNEVKVGTASIQRIVQVLSNHAQSDSGAVSTVKGILVIQDRLTSYANKVRH